MNPMILAAIGSLLRWALAIGAGYLVRRGVWEQAEAETYVTTFAAALALAVVSLAWSQWQKYQTRRVLLVALASTRRLAEQEATTIAAAGVAPPVTTPASVVPVLADKS